MDLVGKRIAKYEVLSLLGKGGTAEVYRASQPALKRQVAIKVLLEEVSEDPDWVRRFELESELLGTLDHPHILPIYDAGEYEGRPYFVMKYFGDGTTLRDMLSGRPWPVARAVKVTEQIAGGLQAAHDAGIVHRDIKPSNILVAPNLHCLVFDFGIAKPSRSRMVGNPKTDAGMIVGTPEFMSPEQCKGDSLDERSDIYSLGILIYQMLTGHPPFTAETAVGVLMKHITEPLPLPIEHVEVPHPVNRVLAKALARLPEDRFDSVTELAEAFARAAEQRDTITLNLSELEDALAVPLSWRQWLQLFQSLDVRWWVVTTAAVLFVMGATSLTQISASYRPSFVRADASPAPAQRQPFVLPVPEVQQETTPDKPEVIVGRLDIQTSEPATIMLNGTDSGSAPTRLDNLKPGRYRIELITDDGRSLTKDVIVTTGAEHDLRFDFARTAQLAARPSLGNPHSSLGATSSWRTREPTRRDGPTPLTTTTSANSESLIAETIWTGYLTDEDCGIRGGKQGGLHLRCAEKCIREGKQALLYAKGKLFPLEGLDRLRLVPGEALRFRGRLHPEGVLEIVAPAED